jgi:plasmid stabilization system protein ParE
MPVVLARPAERDLDEIWDWNKKTYGVDHAFRYLDMLQGQIDAIGAAYSHGKVVESRPGLRYIRLGKRKSGHGHVAVYRIDVDYVNVVHVFHTAKDWQAKLAEEFPD